MGEDTLFTLYFADDQIVTAEDLSYIIRKLHKEYEIAALTKNKAKCEYLEMGNEETSHL